MVLQAAPKTELYHDHQTFLPGWVPLAGGSREAPRSASRSTSGLLFPSCREAPAAPLPQPRPWGGTSSLPAFDSLLPPRRKPPWPRFDHPSRVQVAGSPCSTPAASGGPSCSSGAAQKQWQETRSQRTSIARWRPCVGNRRDQEAVNIFLKAPILETGLGGVLRRQEKT